MTKPKLPRHPSPKPKDKTADASTEVLDEDGVFKDFVSRNVAEVIELIKPDLFADVNWAIAPEFCEQELINFLRGRARVKGKRKVADKLIKLKLLVKEKSIRFSLAKRISVGKVVRSD